MRFIKYYARNTLVVLAVEQQVLINIEFNVIVENVAVKLKITQNVSVVRSKSFLGSNENQGPINVSV